jgi:hypothetical protein
MLIVVGLIVVAQQSQCQKAVAPQMYAELHKAEGLRVRGNGGAKVDASNILSTWGSLIAGADPPGAAAKLHARDAQSTRGGRG